MAGCGDGGATFDAPTPGRLLVNDTLRIALIAIVAVAVAKFVLPRIPGAAPLAAWL